MRCLDTWAWEAVDQGTKDDRRFTRSRPVRNDEILAHVVLSTEVVHINPLSHLRSLNALVDDNLRRGVSFWSAHS
jgi:hypothetical protein